MASQRIAHLFQQPGTLLQISMSQQALNKCKAPSSQHEEEEDMEIVVVKPVEDGIEETEQALSSSKHETEESLVDHQRLHHRNARSTRANTALATVNGLDHIPSSTDGIVNHLGTANGNSNSEINLEHEEDESLL
ncbi:hypothetical protein QYF36_003900 [Acer negundo]|nr:hypothetical protein QYF36_003900 [Acer negundo]